MLSSFSERANLTCPECGKAFQAEVWLIVDASQRPDLLEKVQQGELHTWPCPHCNTLGEVNAPLLLYYPGSERPLIYSPAQGVSEEIDRAHVAKLTSLLREQLGEVWQDDWLTQGLLEIPRELLPALVGAGPEAAWRQMAEQDRQAAFAAREALEGLSPEERAQAILDTMLADKPIALLPGDVDETLFRAVAQLKDQTQTDAETAPRLEAIEARLRQARQQLQGPVQVLSEAGLLGRHLLEFVNAESLDESRRIVEQYSDLRTGEADVLLQTASAVAGHEDDRSLLDRRRALLRRCQIAGVEQAFAEEAWGDLPVPQKFRADLLQAAEALRRYVHTGDPAALSQAIAVWGRILTDSDFASSPEPFQTVVLNDAGGAFLRRYRASGDPADLDQALAVFQQALETSVVSSPHRPAILNNLGSGLSARYAQRGDVTDLEAAIHAWQQAVHLAPPAWPDRAALLNSLGSGLHDRYVRAGDLSDLDQAVALYQEAGSLAPPASPGQVSILNNLATGLRDRYTRTGDLADLDQAILTLRQAIDLPSPEPAYRAMLLSNVGDSLRIRAARTGSADDLQQAMQVLNDSVQLVPPASPDRSRRMGHLAVAAYEAYRLGGDSYDLYQANYLLEEALKTIPRESTDYPVALAGLGAVLYERFVLTDDPELLNQAVERWQEAIQLAPSASPTRIEILNDLGAGLQKRYTLTTHPSDLEQAVQAYREVCARGLDTHPEVVLAGSSGWGDWALERSAWEEAAQAFAYGLQAIERLVHVQLLRAGKEAWLREAQTLCSGAAYALAQCGDLNGAVVTLEGGRARLLAEAMERSRSDLERLPSLGQAGLYEQYRSSVAQVRQLENMGRRPEAIPPSLDLLSELRAAHAELDAAVDAIRQIPGYQNLFHAPDFAHMQQALVPPGSAEDDSLAAVYLSVTQVGGLALIVHAGGVRSVYLNFTQADLKDLLVKRDDQDEDEDEGEISGYLPGQFGLASLNESLNVVLPRLGEQVMQPVVTALAELYPSLATGTQARSVRLIPTGLLALLPLHAACYQTGGQAKTILDDLAVAYAPSARALGHCRETLMSLPGGEPSFLGVGNPLPLPAGTSSLAYAKAEVEEIALQFGDRARLLCDADATRAEVEQSLRTATYVHLSCHGQFVLQDPLSSGVILSNGEQLTLTQLLAQPPLNMARLAVLSACQTAISDFSKLPEEAVGLPSGFLQAGVPGVVGTLWPVNDVSTALLMIKFYEYHLQGDAGAGAGPLHPAVALRQAQFWLRDVTNAELSELFEKYKMTAPDRPEQSRMAFELASEKFREHTLRDPTERPFAQPYYWAPFVFHGV